MRVILLQDVEKLGKKFDVKEVADGYARNFLLPKGLVKPATEEVLKQLEAEKEAAAKKAEEELKATEEIVERLDNQEIEIVAKIDENGKLYGSLTALKIARVLKDKGFDVSKNQIKLKESIKEVGEYDIIVEFPHGLEAKVKIIVTEEAKEEI
ncbi:MAG: large subunit ribosomal protein L9 [Parcubacteria group bacterium LiPW_39]|nr:MAG: large subunit ribosomal protein L9 [Parcubacteria group bacterium LiPW_39]